MGGVKPEGPRGHKGYRGINQAERRAWWWEDGVINIPITETLSKSKLLLIIPSISSISLLPPSVLPSPIVRHFSNRPLPPLLPFTTPFPRWPVTPAALLASADLFILCFEHIKQRHGAGKNDRKRKSRGASLWLMCLVHILEWSSKSVFFPNQLQSILSPTYRKRF